jgi:hypothetical protein
MQSVPRLYLYSKDEQKKVSQPWTGSSNELAVASRQSDVKRSAVKSLELHC